MIYIKETSFQKATAYCLAGLAVLGMITLIYFYAWSVGITPANKAEREFIEALNHKYHTTKVKALHETIRNSNYVSRRHFFAAEDAFNDIEQNYKI